MSSDTPRNDKSGIDRRTFMKSTAGIGLGVGVSLAGINNTRATPVCCGTDWPKRHWRDYEAPLSSTSDTTTVTSAGTHLELINSTYIADRWRFYFRTETNIGQVNSVPNQSDAVGYNLDGTHKLEVSETVNSGALDSYHGSEERNFGVTGASGPTPDWAQVVFNIGTALAGRWDQRVGDVITAAQIINEMVFPGTSGEEPQGIFYDWDVNGEGKVGNYLRWTTEYPPKGQTGNDNHQIKVTSGLTDIPDGSYSYTTSDYTASWTVDLGSMYEPSSMSTAEKKTYGVERVKPSQLATTLSSLSVDLDTVGPIYRAKNPPVKAKLNTD